MSPRHGTATAKLAPATAGSGPLGWGLIRSRCSCPCDGRASRKGPASYWLHLRLSVTLTFFVQSVLTLFTHLHTWLFSLFLSLSHFHTHSLFLSYSGTRPSVLLVLHNTLSLCQPYSLLFTSPCTFFCQFPTFFSVSSKHPTMVHVTPASLYRKVDISRLVREIVKGIPAGLVISLNAWGRTSEQPKKQKTNTPSFSQHCQ